MAAILGLVAAAAASVDCHLLEINCLVWVEEREARTTGDWTAAHRLRTRWQDMDMATRGATRARATETRTEGATAVWYTAFLLQSAFLRFPKTWPVLMNLLMEGAAKAANLRSFAFACFNANIFWLAFYY
jgi:hypothetical protein